MAVIFALGYHLCRAAARAPVQPEGLLILVEEHVVESQLAAQVQRHHALDVVRPDIVGAHGWLISFGLE